MENIFVLTEPFLIVICTVLISVLPGCAVACHLNLEPLDRPVVFILTGFTLMYLCEFGAYLLSLPPWFPIVLLLLISLISMFLFSRRRSKYSLIATFPWAETIAWLTLSIWGLALQFKIVVYGAQIGWWGDWFEHYERSIFFLEQMPPETKFISGLWTLSARGPLFNASAGLLMGGFGKEYWTYQVIATVLNAFPVIALALLFQNISGLRRLPALIWSGVIFALAPFAVQQVIYPWTKMFTTGFILVGVHFYIMGAKRGDMSLMAWAFVSFALGILAHYMTVLFASFFLIHFLYTITKNRLKIKLLIYPFGSCLLFLSTWFVYLVVNFGIVGTIMGNSTMGKFAEDYHKEYGITMNYREVVLWNTFNTLVPYSMRHNWNGPGRSPDPLKQGWPLQPKNFSSEETQLNRKVVWKLDLINNQSTLPGNMGWAGFAALFVVILTRRKNMEIKNPSQTGVDNLSPGPIFWPIFFIFGIFINLLTHRNYVLQGMSYINFQPFLFLFVVFLFKWLLVSSNFIKVSLAGLFLVESVFKTYIWVQMHARPVFLKEVPGSGFVIQGPGLNDQYVRNYFAKGGQGILYVSDQFGEISGFFSLICVGLVAGILTRCLMSWISDKRERQSNDVHLEN